MKIIPFEQIVRYQHTKSTFTALLCAKRPLGNLITIIIFGAETGFESMMDDGGKELPVKGVF